MPKRISNSITKTWSPNLQSKFGVGDLILFALYSAAEDGRCGFEKLAKECFQRFPQVFVLQGYPKYLDSRKLDRPLRTLRKRKLITGDPKTSFSLTLQGRQQAKDTAKILCQKKLL